MNGKLNRNIGFSLLPFAFLFLFDPGYTLFDILPDCLGYLIICIAIINLSDIDHNIRSAFNSFRKAAIISVLKYVAVYFLYSVFIDNHQNLGMLLFLFVFSLFELITVIPAYKSLFEGLLNLGIMHDGTAVYYKKIKLRKVIERSTQKTIIYKRESRKNITEKLFSFTVFFTVIHRIATTLPEFTTLISDYADAYEFINLLRWFGIILVAPIGLIWLIRMIVYCNKIRKDKVFINSLSKRFLEKAKENCDLYTVRPISTGLIIMLVAFVLSIDIYTDFSNLVPDFIFYAALILSACILKKYSKKWLGLLITASFGVLSSSVAFFYSEHFHSMFHPSAIRKNLTAYYSYYTMFGLQIADAVVLILTVSMAMLVLWDICKKHTELTFFIDKGVKDKMLYIRGIIAVSVASLIAAAGSVFFVWTQPFKFYHGWYFYYSTMISAASGIILAAIAAYFINYMNSAVKSRYIIPDFE